MGKKQTNKNSVEGADLGSEFGDIEFNVSDPFNEGDDSNSDTPQTPVISEEESVTPVEKASSNRGKKKGKITLRDCVAYAKELEANGYFKENKVTSINVTTKTMHLTSNISKYFDNVAHYQLVTGIVMKVLTDNKDEVKEILDELAKKNSEGLMD